jgi:hypothetical protein
MIFREVDYNGRVLNGKYDVFGSYTTDGGSTFYYVWEVEFNNETIQDFINATTLKDLGITGICAVA